MSTKVGSDFKKIEGSCHCQNIRFVLLWPGPKAEIAIRNCDCTFCRKRVGSWTSHPDAKLDVHIDRMSSVSKYRFGTKTAEFYVCSVCGVVPFVISDIDDVLYAVVNVTSFDNVDISTLSHSPINFDGEDTGTRLDRRKRNWISYVRFDTSAT